MKIKRALSVALDVLLWVIIALAAVFVAVTLSAKQNDGVPRLFGYSPVVVLSNSMKGTGPQNFSAGDLVFIKAADTSTLKVGDVVSFWDLINGKKQLNTHRIVKIENSGSNTLYTTRGDANNANDPDKKAAGDIVGIYRYKIAGAGFVMNFLRSQWGMLFCLVLPLLAFFIWRLVKLVLAASAYRTAKIGEESSRPLQPGKGAAEEAAAAGEDKKKENEQEKTE